ncbi:Zinc import ATP-binding protein ZnuC [Verticillium dahliae VDG1]|nr:Zinc import ATP-binding protein ZnuC [Verticillium dahliae VDG1]
MAVLTHLLGLGLGLIQLAAAVGIDDSLPSYHYGAPIQVECMNRSSDTGEHLEDANHQLIWIPSPECSETGKPLEFAYGIESEVNCTIPMIDDPFFHLLEFYIHNDAPLSCRLPSRPAPHVEIAGQKPPERDIVSFGAGVTVAGAYFLGVVLPKRLKNRTLGGATPLGYGVNGVGVGNGWGYSKASKRLD